MFNENGMETSFYCGKKEVRMVIIIVRGIDRNGWMRGDVRKCVNEIAMENVLR